MSSLISDHNPILLQRNKFVSDSVAPIFNSSDINKLFSTLDNVYKAPEMVNRLIAFNEKIKDFGISYNPSETKTKFVGACTNCVTITEIVSRICENYGCVQQYLTSNYDATNCNSFSVTKVNPTADLVTVQQISSYVAQEARSAIDATQTCFTVPLVVTAIKERVMRDAMCSCLALDAMAEALITIRNTMAKVIDRAILYGNFNAGTFNSISNFDSIDNLIPASQKLTASGEMDLYKKITKAIANIVGVTGCDMSRINVISRGDVRVRMLGALDNNGRPITTELVANGINCEVLKIACANVYTCQSLKYQNVAGVITSDIFVGLKDDYAFGKYVFPAVEPQFDQVNGNAYNIFSEVRYGGKLLNPDSFYKITATL